MKLTSFGNAEALRKFFESTVTKKTFSRLIWAIPTLVFITLVTFAAGYFAPRDPATLKAGEKSDAATIARIRKEMGLDRPFLVRYGEYVGNAIQGDLGNSLYGKATPVTETLLEGLKNTGRLAALAILVAAMIGITFGGIAAIWRNRWPDRILVMFSTFGICVPNFVLAPVMVYLFSLQLGVLPVSWSEQGIRENGLIYYLILPVLILSLRPAALITRLTRAGMVETLSQDFIRTAFAKGVPFWRVMIVHALRNSLVPIVTAIGTTFGFLLTGSFIIETAFSIPGLGLSSIQAINRSDYPVIQGTVLLFAVMFIIVNLVVDLLLPILDPRIREENQA